MDDPEIKGFIHGLNSQAYSLNKGIVQRSATTQDVPINKEIYNPTPQPAPQPQPQPQQVVQPQPQPQVVQQVQQQDLTPLIDRVTNLEKQINKFVNLIERNVAKKAKEINIRIKLNDDSTDKK